MRKTRGRFWSMIWRTIKDEGTRNHDGISFPGPGFST